MMTNDELQGVEPDPNPSIKCGDCGDKYPFHEYWKERYVEPDNVNEYEETWRCDRCKRIKERRESNQKITEWE